MQDIIFSSDKHFTMHDFHISHSQLLIRAAEDTGNGFRNVDIIFMGVHYVQLPPSFAGLTIQESSFEESNILYPSVKKFLSYPSSHLFEVITEDTSYYVAAGICMVYENELSLNESSVGPANEKKRGRLIHSSAKKG
ncbi:hypothetical protein [Chitinophaga sancti]|uniref:hypothetical protein n=1 Tax=Chitinophaga sancti TaxID=1004 RepID=UPI003F7B0778